MRCRFRYFTICVVVTLVCLLLKYRTRENVTIKNTPKGLLWKTGIKSHHSHLNVHRIRSVQEAIVRNLNNGENQESTLSPNITSQLLIISVSRSGSTLLSYFFAELQDAFFSYEPLHWFHIMLRDPVVYGRLTFDEKNIKRLSIKILDSILACNLDYTDFMTKVSARNVTQLFDYRNCARNRKNEIYCFERFRDVCRSKSLNVIKTVRMSIDSIRYFLLKYPHLRVIHLIRDPRGSLCSWDCPQEKQWRYTCSRIRNDITARWKLEAEFPGRLLEVFYEDFAHHPHKMAAKMLAFVGRSYSGNMKYWVHVKMLSGAKFDSKWRVIRPNSTEAAYEWIKRFREPKYMTYANKYCNFTLYHGKYVHLSQPKHVVNFTIPQRSLKYA